MVTVTRNSWTSYVLFLSIGISTTLLILSLMFIQTAVINFNRFSFQATLAPLKGDCMYGIGPCTRDRAYSACTGVYNCFRSITNIFRRGVDVVGVIPQPFTRNDTTISDIIDIIYEDRSHLSAFIILLIQQPLGWICLLIYLLCRNPFRIIGGTIFTLTRSLGFIASIINTQATTAEIKMIMRQPPDILSTLNDNFPALVFTIMIIETITTIVLMVYHAHNNQVREQEVANSNIIEIEEPIRV